MQRTEAEFCRQEAARISRLARECADPEVRDQLVTMANEWLERAKAKLAAAKSA